MSSRSSWLKAAAAVLGLVAVAIAWVQLAPQGLGGPVSYVITSGSSMAPLLHEGDLVVVKEAATYEVGDTVAYINPDLQSRLVLHRIVSRDGERFEFQGDNNDFVDPYRPTETQLVGKMWAHVPGAGRILERIRTPRNAAILAAGLGLMGAGGLGATKRTRDGKHRSRKPTRPKPPPQSSSPAPTIVMIASFLLAAFLLIGWAAMTRPERRDVPVTFTYENQGRFGYSAPAPAGSIYERDIETGDPVFLRLVNRADVEFDYTFASDSSHSMSGIAQLHASVVGGNGWNRSLSVGEETPFEGDHATVAGTLDLLEIRRLVSSLERATGVVSDTYQLQLAPEVRVEGSLAGLEVEDSFTPVLSLQLDEFQLQLPPASTGEETSGDPTVANEAVDIAGTDSEPNRLSLGPVELDVLEARTIAAVGAGIALLLIIVFGVPVLLLRRRDEDTQIRARYGSLLVPMRSLDGDIGGLAELDDVDSLAKIAVRYDRPILHDQTNGTHRYLVEGDGLVYVYRGQETSDL